ncbi:MAG: F-type H+-transporting ATPase subunit delta [Halieaceae bacterium]|jgi:F-type H+-transporting ATPase subunit delta
MAELSTLARPYAKAAFEYASSEGALSDWLAELQLLAELVREPSVKSLLSDPALTTDQQAGYIVDICGESLGASRQRFVRVLAENRRLALSEQIFNLFRQYKALREQTVDVQMISAFDVPEEVRIRIAKALGKRLEREVVVSTDTDSSLLGGVLIRAGDMVIDGSVRGRLNKLAEVLTN